MNHFTERALSFPGVRDLRLVPSIDPPNRLIVFIHGFAGGALSTWKRFPFLLPSEPKTAKSDLVFYGYDGISAELIASAGIFGQFMFRITSDSGLINASIPDDARRNFRGYDDVWIVGHSLGAVVARWALLDAFSDGSAWANRSKMIFYAPAHSGAAVVRLALAGFGGYGVLHLIKAGVQFKSPLIAQLRPDSDDLKALATRTAAALTAGKTQAAARKVLIAQYEHIVTNTPFPGDPVPSFAVAHAHHTSICKPQDASSVSFTKLLEVL